MVRLLQQAAGERPAPWTAAQVHDSVAKIAAQPAYTTNVQQSLLGRFVRYLFQRLADFVSLFKHSLDARILLIAVAILVVAVIVARVVVAQRLAEDRRRLGLGFNTKTGARTDYWAIARDEAANGRYIDACHAVYAAVIDSFVRQGLMSFHASKTSGDYARDLRRAGAPFAADFRLFARQFDRALFGTTAVTADDYTRLRELAERAARDRMSA